MNKIIDNLFNDLFQKNKTLLEVKKIVIKNGLVNEFVNYCHNMQMGNGIDDLFAYHMYYEILEMDTPEYTFNTFYNGLTDEEKLDILL